jgi:septal ring factor EnvC (AmiA/AmiB activator)
MQPQPWADAETEMVPHDDRQDSPVADEETVASEHPVLPAPAPEPASTPSASYVPRVQLHVLPEETAGRRRGVGWFRHPHVLWALRVAALLLVVLAVVAAAISFNNGRAWQDRARRQEARATTAERQAAALRVQLDRSEAAVRDLQSRMGALADEKAQVEDQREGLRVYARNYKQLIQMAGDVSTDLTTCITELARAMADPYSSYSLSYAVSYCERALDNYGQLQQVIDGLPTPSGL